MVAEEIPALQGRRRGGQQAEAAEAATGGDRRRRQGRRRARLTGLGLGAARPGGLGGTAAGLSGLADMVAARDELRPSAPEECVESGGGVGV